MAGIKITEAEFKRACDKWASGNYTLQELSDEFGLTVPWLSQKFKKAGVTRGQDVKIARDAKKRALEISIADASVELRKYIVDAQKLPTSGSIGLMRKALIDFQKLVEENKPLASKDDDFKTILTLMKILESGWKINKEIFKLDKDEVSEGDLPTLEIINMTEQDVIEERARQIAEEAEFSGSGQSDFAELPELGLEDDPGDDEEDDIVDESGDDDDVIVEEGDHGTLTA